MKSLPTPPVSVPESADVRRFWLSHADATPAQIVGASTAVPRNLVPFLVRSKKTSSIARKYVRGDSISNMEAAWHTLVIPVVFPVWMSGVYAYENRRHVMHRLPAQKTYTAVLSALIQPDFEAKSVMYEMIKLDPEHEIVGKALDEAWQPPAPEQISAETELELKQHFIFHFARSKRLPAANSVRDHTMGSPSAQFLKVGRDVLSLELLKNCLREQMRVEFAALVDAVKDYGLELEYTWDPPVIFARTVSPDLLDELWLEAVTAPGVVPPEIATIAFNDFRNHSIIPRLREKLGSHVSVCSKADLSAEPRQGVLRVLHNNSDAFGQHILTSPCSASLDGAIGSCSSAAASLCKPDVQRYVYIEASPPA